MTYAEMLKEYREAIAAIRKLTVTSGENPWVTLGTITNICDKLIVKPRRKAA